MNKINAVIKREYLAIVKTKTFIIMTILLPLGMVLMFTIPFLMAFAKTGVTTIAVLDESGLFIDKLEGNNNLELTFVEGYVDEIREQMIIDYDALLHIPNFDLQYPGGIRLIANKQIGITTESNLESQIESIIEDERFAAAGIDRELVNRLQVRIRIESVVVTGEVEKTGSATISLMVGYIMGFVMYFIIFLYGNMISTSVINEKKNRIVEILVSSLKPFELMIGKIIGIAAVALTQLFIWLICGVIFFFSFTIIVLPHLSISEVNTEIPAEMQGGFATTMINFAENPSAILNIPLLIFGVFFYFLFGYFFYSTLFAAVGSLADDHNQSQNFMWPITIPIMISLFIMIHVVDNPHSPIAIWSSLVPFCSPIVMLARIPFNVPLWQVWASMLILVLSFFGSTWLSGKIYRMGILLYGKKLTWKDLWRFICINP